MPTFDFLHIDADINNDGKINGKAEYSGCYGVHSQFYMTAYGDINPCDFYPINFGNIRDMPIQAIWQKMVSHPDFNKRFHSCRMQNREYRGK